MPVSMAGSRGGIVRGSASGVESPFLSRLLSGAVSFEELKHRFSDSVFPDNVTLVINNSCNLNCGHCYLQVKRLTAPAMKEQEWKQLVDTISPTNPELFCLSGKEIFLGETGSRILSYMREVKDRENAGYRIGLITNGTLIHKHTEAIKRAAPSYFDISLDGIESDHDAVRGKGAFAMVLPNLKWAVETFGDQFFVTLTIQKQNFRRVKDAVAFLHGLGVKNVAIGFYLPLSYTSERLALTDEDVDYVFDQLSNLDEIRLNDRLNVCLDLDIINLQPLKAFLRSKWFALEQVQESNGEHFVERELSNGVRLSIRFAPYPTGVWRSMRITAEGNYLAAEDTIDTTRYAERTIGNVREFGYDFPSLQKHALASRRFQEILSQYYEQTLPALVQTCANNLTVRRAAA